MSDVRIDKYLWMVRLFKTRSKAAEACRKGQVKIGEKAVKPAQVLLVGNKIEVKFTPIWRQYEIKAFPKSRIKGALVPDFLTENTPQEELDRFAEYRLAQAEQFMYSPSKGRPTKKDRRAIEKYKDDD